VDTDNENEIPVGQMKQAGIKVVSDHQESLMHNKFAVIDHQEVWTGSWNYTHNCTFRNNNNALAIVSEKLAENYTTEFDEMFVGNQFGSGSPSNTPHNWVKVGDIQVENYFAPEEDVQAIILREIKAAKNNIQFMTYVLTDNKIGEALADRKKDGIVVQGVVEDRFAESTGSEVPYLLKNGVDVLRDGNHYLMHHKVIILDGQTVITGSYNFTRNAQEQNDENVLVIHNKEIAARYLEEFQKVYGQAEK
jgi:phosphatidylserine/phosphatidylglycerophosphate/cardiolipin synthase-like enzyme